MHWQSLVRFAGIGLLMPPSPHLTIPVGLNFLLRTSVLRRKIRSNIAQQFEAEEHTQKSLLTCVTECALLLPSLLPFAFAFTFTLRANCCCWLVFLHTIWALHNKKCYLRSGDRQSSPSECDTDPGYDRLRSPLPLLLDVKKLHCGKGCNA